MDSLATAISWSIIKDNVANDPVKALTSVSPKVSKSSVSERK